ncbi:MAG: hypothetical protein NVSMB18_34170 [Acetobacteraceae bacterium]
MATVTGGGTTTFINAGSNDANGVAQALANTITAGLGNGTLVRTGGSSPPAGTSGVLTISSQGTTIQDQPGVTVDLINGGGNSVATGAVSVAGTGAANQVVIGDNENITYFTGGGTGTVVTGDGNNLIGTPTAGGGVFNITTGSGNDVIVAITGQNTVSAGLGNNVIFTGNANDTVIVTGNDTIVGAGGNGAAVGSATDVVRSASGTVLIGAFNKNLTFVGGTGTATILLSQGTDSIDGGVGGGLFAGGLAGKNTIAGGTGASGSTIFGAGSGDLLQARGGASNLIAAGAGNETLTGAGSTGNNIFYTALGPNSVGASASIQGGSGSDSFLVGSGASTVDGGLGNDLIGIFNGRAGGTVVINNFNANEKVTLVSYGSGELANDLAGQKTVNGSAVVTLSDKTTITFTGIATVNAGSFV